MGICMSHAEKSDRDRRALRSSLRETFRAELQKTVPPQTTVLHYLGALIVCFLLLQISTGLLLMVYYRPSAEAAYSSISIIMDEVRLGWFIRSVHRWGTDILLILAAFHLIRVYFSRSYELPRQLSWVSGIVLLLILVAFDFSGALLPWDQQAYWSIDAVRETVGGIPLVGSFLQTLFWGAPDLGEEGLLRSYAFHIGVLPWMMILFLSFHLLLVWRFGIKEPTSLRAAPLSDPVPFFPDFLLKLFMAFLLGFGLLLSAAIVFPPPISEQADPLAPLLHLRTRWYLLSGEQFLHNLSSAVAAVIAATLFLLFVLVPFLDAGPVSSTKRVARWALGLAVITAWVLLGVRGYLS